jgi:hypothetical protein
MGDEDMKRQLQVYVSSTFGDLKEHRAAVIDAILRTGAYPVAIENFGATPESPVDACRRAVRASDVLVLVVARRYGATPQGMTTSYTELEYEVAQEAGIPVLAFLLADDSPRSPDVVDSGDNAERLHAFKHRLRETQVVDFFTSSSDLALRVSRALHHFIARTGRDSTDVLHQLPTPRQDTEGARVEHDDPLLRIEDHLESLRSTVGQLQAQVESAYRAGVPGHPVDTAAVRPAGFLGPMANKVDAEVCFVAMPYSRSWSKALEETLVDICKTVGFKILIAKDMNGRFVPHDIWQGITSAGVIVADITDANPNVAYEIGLADVLGKDVVLLCQGDSVPFDFLGQRLICYEDTMKGAITLREELTARLRQLISRSRGE